LEPTFGRPRFAWSASFDQVGGEMSDTRWNVTDDAERATWATHATTLACALCQRAWVVSAERWRVYLIDGIDDVGSLTVPFCPACAVEFDGEPL
jgi:hypothetical protein